MMKFETQQNLDKPKFSFMIDLKTTIQKNWLTWTFYN